ncbi:hypothetical protein C4K04_1768 [Pseudomonas chlororaphis]|uniref:Uncharacterized protein n=1 Tax=Pseudomonas chlororaphis TaxID=587753 RepID=A0A3G7TMH5_9PSED|nr:hypothetical protein C4K04_1768 [Pseudomonas chlororaphis]
MPAPRAPAGPPVAPGPAAVASPVCVGSAPAAMAFCSCSTSVSCASLGVTTSGACTWGAWFASSCGLNCRLLSRPRVSSWPFCRCTATAPCAPVTS